MERVDGKMKEVCCDKKIQLYVIRYVVGIEPNQYTTGAPKPKNGVIYF